MRADGTVARRRSTRAPWRPRRAGWWTAGVTSIAIVFLHAYANPRHEAQAATLVAQRHPTIAVTTSHEVAPEIREYERASTTVANAYIKPLARQYLDAMARRVAGLGIPAPLLLMLSSGGLTHVAEAERTPVQMLESGPAAGALAAAFFGRDDSRGNLLAFDMGGTTAKLSPGRRRRAADRLRLRGGAAEALPRGQRAADPHLDHRADRDRRRRRLDRPRGRDRSAEGRSAQRRLAARARRLRSRRHSSRP